MADGAGDDLAVRLGDLAGSWQQEDGLEATLRAVARGASGLVPGADAGSVAVVVDGRVAARAASGPLAEHVDVLQADVGQGPSLDAALSADPVRSDDLAVDPRWPRFSRRAAGLGVASVLACRLAVPGDEIGALTLLGRRPGTFGTDAERVADLVATHASLALTAVRHGEQMRSLTDTRDVIGQAKGILMERLRVDAEEAFALLAATSQRTHRKLRDVADELCLTGRLPGPDDRT
jgi:transcriptional regulator with GAF, ATPase, and Fis domain